MSIVHVVYLSIHEYHTPPPDFHNKETQPTKGEKGSFYLFVCLFTHTGEKKIILYSFQTV